MRNILIKAYAAFYPAGEPARAAVAKAGKDALGNDEPWLFLEKDMLRISFEGLCFPLDEVLAALEASLPSAARGKLDFLDLEDWTLTRYELLEQKGAGAGRAFAISRRGLNNVLDYSGH